MLRGRRSRDVNGSMRSRVVPRSAGDSPEGFLAPAKPSRARQRTDDQRGCQTTNESVIDDTQRSKAFYEQVFGAKAVYEDEDAVAFEFEFENMVVNILRVPAAHELIAPAPVGDADAPRRFQLTIGVQDTDVVCEQLTARGVELLNGPTDRVWGMRTAAFTDPDGHIWEVAAKIPS
jgi:catechol 2,3-dioxygenase-like lactoylglutathione lyase family enzyme